MADERDMSALDAALAATKEAAAEASASSSGGGSKKSQATELVDIATELAVELWEDLAGNAWITFPVDEHHEHWKIKSEATRRWLRGEYFRRHQKAVGSQGMQDALGLLEAHAHETRQRHQTYVRVAELDGHIYIDLCDQDWNAVEIRPEAWEVVSNPPVRFRRARGMRDLPIPAPDGDLNELRRFVNVASDDDWRLLVGWLLAAWRAKSTTARILRVLVDPNTCALRAEPKELRELYENDQEVLFDVQRPALITGIADVVTNSDLLDRTLTIDLPRIPEERRRTEEDFWAEFDAVCPRILSGIFTGLCLTLAVGSVKLDRKPRMADFAAKAVAVERALGWPAGSFLDAYQGNRETARETSLDNSLIAPLIRQRADEGGFTGRARQLLDWMEGQVGEQTRKRRDWPKQPNNLSGILRRLMPDLRAAGWADVTFGSRTGQKGTQITIRKVRATAPSTGPKADSAPAVSMGGVDGQQGDRHQISAHSELAGVAGVDGVDHFPFFSSRGVNPPPYPKGVLCQGCRGLGWDWHADPGEWRCHGCGKPWPKIKEWRA
jgi:hypothetical protein